MDDCSPDHTPDVAQEFHDARVRYVRNESNLGNIANYNKAIGLARGKYIWLISADDSLRRPYVLAQYVKLLGRHPSVGYVFCPSIRLEHGQECGVMTFTAPANHDTIFNGRDLLIGKLLESNCVAAPSAMARKECYEKVGLFPRDLPYSGDWYLWCMFALYYDVGYLAEPMVYRRFHRDNLSNYFYMNSTAAFFANNVAVPWRIKERADTEHCGEVVKRCKETIVSEYVWQLIPDKKKVKASLTLVEFEESLRRYVRSQQEHTEILARVFAGLGDYYYWQCEFSQALHYYGVALRTYPWVLGWWIKYGLVPTGHVGMRVRDVYGGLRRLAKRAIQSPQ